MTDKIRRRLSVAAPLRARFSAFPARPRLAPLVGAAAVYASRPRVRVPDRHPAHVHSRFDTDLAPKVRIKHESNAAVNDRGAK